MKNDAIWMIIKNGRALDKLKDSNPWCHNNELFRYMFVIFIQVVFDALAWHTIQQNKQEAGKGLAHGVTLNDGRRAVGQAGKMAGR